MKHPVNKNKSIDVLVQRYSV